MGKTDKGMRPQDIVVLLKKTTPQGRKMNNKQLSESLVISASEISESLERSRIAGLVSNDKANVNILAIQEFLIHGIRYVYPAQMKGIVRGLPTASFATPMNGRINHTNEPIVWQYKYGHVRGQNIEPLYPTAIEASLNDEDLYALLAIVDSLRVGNAREREIASEELIKTLSHYDKE